MNARGGRSRPSLSGYLQQVQPQVQAPTWQVVPQVQVLQVHFGLPQLAWAFSADFWVVFMASMVCVVRRDKSHGTRTAVHYILLGNVYISLPPGPAACGPGPWP